MFMARKPLGLLITVSSKPFAGFNAFSKKHRRNCVSALLRKITMLIQAWCLGSAYRLFLRKAIYILIKTTPSTYQLRVTLTDSSR
jgi:hypothetical protein